MATLFVDKIDPQSGTTLSLGSSGDTLQATAGTTNNLGISMADQFRLASTLSNPNAADITANLERVDTNGFAKIGTGMTESSGIFTFPSTGLYHVKFVGKVFYNNDYTGIKIFVSTDGTNFVDTAFAESGTTSVNGFTSMVCECFVNVTNTSNFKVKFHAFSMTNASLRGDTSSNYTNFTFIRLGDSQ